MGRRELEDVEVELLAKTGLAWLVTATGDRADAVWVPISVAELEKNEGKGTYTLTLPHKLAVEKGLV